jgi:hypothetical protein
LKTKNKILNIINVALNYSPIQSEVVSLLMKLGLKKCIVIAILTVV